MFDDKGARASDGCGAKARRRQARPKTGTNAKNSRTLIIMNKRKVDPESHTPARWRGG